MAEADAALHPLQLWHNAWLGSHATVARFTDVTAPHDSRCRFAGDITQLPQSWLEEEPSLARAALAHIAAHRRFGSPQFEAGSLRPVQIALVSIFEDARVEQLAIAKRPGLRRLWWPFVTGSDGSATTDLLARLIQALFNENHRDEHRWVAKGQQLFFAQRERWCEPLLSRELGGLLGNDLGQMRLQFNWKSYVVAARYRDDGHGLWRFDADDEPPRELTSLGGGSASSAASAGTQRDDLADATAEPPTSPSWLQPEWDYRIGRLRPDWVTLRHEPTQRGDATALQQWLLQQRPALQQLRRTLSRSDASLRRQSRQATGDELDLDAAIGAMIDRRRRALPDHRLYRGRRRQQQPRTLVLLVDASQSSSDRAGDSDLSILEIERRAAALLAEAGALRGDHIAVLAFRSNGRGDVQLQLLQSFERGGTSHRLQQLAGLQPGLSTRLGATLRATIPLFECDGAEGGWVITLSDGEPSDIDNSDSRYLVEDARRAVGELRRKGLRCAALGLDPAHRESLSTIFGSHFSRSLPRIEQLPQQLQQLYRLLR